MLADQVWWGLSFLSGPESLPDLDFQDRIQDGLPSLRDHVELEGLQGEEPFSWVDFRTSSDAGRLQCRESRVRRAGSNTNPRLFSSSSHALSLCDKQLFDVLL